MVHEKNTVDKQEYMSGLLPQLIKFKIQLSFPDNCNKFYNKVSTQNN